MTDGHLFNNISLGGRAGNNPGQFKLYSGGLAWKKQGGGKIIEVDKADITSMTWMRIPRSYQLGIGTKEGLFYRFFGFREQDVSNLTNFIQKSTGISPEEKQLSVSGHNWGGIEISGNMLSFNVETKEAFEVSLADVSQTQMQGKTDVVLEFHVDDTTGANEKDSLMDLSFHVQTSNTQFVGDEHRPPAQILWQTILSKADVGSSEEAVVTFDGIAILTPRGRYSVELHLSFLRLQGQANDFKIQCANGDVQDDEHDKLRSLKELGFPEYNPIFIKKHITIAMTARTGREMASVLLSSLSMELFYTEDIVKGFIMLLESAEDTALNILDASDELGLFLAVAKRSVESAQLKKIRLIMMPLRQVPSSSRNIALSSSCLSTWHYLLYKLGDLINQLSILEAVFVPVLKIIFSTGLDNANKPLWSFCINLFHDFISVKFRHMASPGEYLCVPLNQNWLSQSCMHLKALLDVQHIKWLSWDVTSFDFQLEILDSIVNPELRSIVNPELLQNMTHEMTVIVMDSATQIFRLILQGVRVDCKAKFTYNNIQICITKACQFVKKVFLDLVGKQNSDSCAVLVQFSLQFMKVIAEELDHSLLANCFSSNTLKRSYNNFSGYVPLIRNFSKFPMESFWGNPRLYVYCRDFSCGHSHGSRVNISRTAIAAARLLLILAERQCSNAEETPILDQRYQYLHNVVPQAKSSGIATDSSRNTIDSSIAVYLLEGKLAVLRFQMQIKQELEYMASWLENTLGSSELLNDPFPRDDILADAETDMVAKDKARELSRNLKSITQLYNHYAAPFNLWKVCLEMLNFANYFGDADIKIVRKIWARLFDPAPTRGGDAEAWSVVKRVGSKLDPAVGACLPMDIICFHLEKAASDRLSSGEELLGDEDVARALLGACKSLPEPVLAVLRTRVSPRRDKFVSNHGSQMRILEDKYCAEGEEMSNLKKIEVRKTAQF